MKIDPNAKGAGFEIKGDPLEIKLNVDTIADAMAEDLRAAIAAQPGSKWNKTGALKRGVRSRDGVVSVPGDHLTRDPVLATKFAADVLPADPTTSARVTKAADLAATKAIK